MNSGDYLLLASAAIGLTVVLALAMRPQPKKAPEAPKEVTRWKRFRIQPAHLHGPLGEPKQVVAEEPKGLKVVAQPRKQPVPVTLSDPDGDVVCQIARRWAPFRWKYPVEMPQSRSLEIVVRKSDAKSFELRCPEGESWNVRGSLRKRECQFLRNGTLVATVHAPEPDSKDYVLEVLKTEDVPSILRLALTLDVATG